MKVVEFVKHNGWDRLADRGIEVRDYPEQGLKVLNYSQFDASKTDEVANECRGLILDNDLNIVCRPMVRFFNYGESGTKDFDFSDCTVFEKADGSMVKIYFCEKTHRWEIGTRGTAFAETNHAFGLKKDWTFREAILDAMNLSEAAFQQCMEHPAFRRSCTYIAEYCSPWNRIVTRYDQPQLVLLAVISNTTGDNCGTYELQQWQTIFANQGMNIRLPKIYHASSGDQLVAMANALEDLQEGFVVFNNKSQQRLKVKSSTYVIVHQLRGEGTPSRTRVMEVVLKNEQDELLTYFPEFSVFVEPVELALKKMLHLATELYAQHQAEQTQKEFALKIKDSDVAPICFKARKDNTTPKAAFESMDLCQQFRLLDKFLPLC